MSNLTRAQEHSRQAKRQYEKGDFWAAVSEYDKAISLGDRSLSAYDGKAAAMSRAEVKDGIAFSAARVGTGAGSSSVGQGLKGSAYEVAEKMCIMFAKDKLVYRAWYRKASILFAMNLFPACLRALDHASQLLGSTTGLTDTETARATEAISKLRGKAIVAQRLGKLKRMDAEVDRQRSESDAKRRKLEHEENRKRLEELERAMALKANTNYIHLLPPDVIRAICRMGMDRGDSYLAVRMSAVNQEWRQIITSNSQFWQTLVLSHKKPVQKTKLWLDRCKGRLKRLVVDSGFDEEHLLAVRAELEGQAALHVDSLDIRHKKIREFHLAHRRFFRNIREFSVRPDDRISVGCSILRPLHTAEQSPLRKLSVSNCTWLLPPYTPKVEDVTGMNPTRDSTHWKTIRNLRISHSSVMSRDPNADGILRLMQDVEDVELDHVNLLSSTIQDIHSLRDDKVVFQLNRLWRYVELDSMSRQSPFRHVTAPNLTHLTIWGGGLDLSEKLLHRGLRRAVPNLIHLEIGKSRLLVPELLDVLKHTTKLRYLGISHCPCDDTFFEQLVRQDEEDSLLPELTALSMGGYENISGSVLKDIVFSRLPRKMKRMLRKQPVDRKEQHQRPPPIRSAFAPTIRPKAADSNAKISSADADQQMGQDDGTKPDLAQLNWLCLDGCARLDIELIEALRKRVKTVLWSNNTISEHRLRGHGRYAWDADLRPECGPTCQLVKYAGTEDSYYVQHDCGNSLTYEEELERFNKTLAASRKVHKRRETSDWTIQSDGSLGLGVIAGPSDIPRHVSVSQT